MHTTYDITKEEALAWLSELELYVEISYEKDTVPPHIRTHLNKMGVVWDETYISNVHASRRQLIAYNKRLRKTFGNCRAVGLLVHVTDQLLQWKRNNDKWRYWLAKLFKHTRELLEHMEIQK